MNFFKHFNKNKKNDENDNYQVYYCSTNDNCNDDCNDDCISQD